MSRAITQPINQVRLTNVAVVRLNKTGKRFEIACYRNKVVNWRNRVETDLDEVLQIESVFENVSKGVLAKNKDLMKAFGTDNQLEACRIILDKGEMQVSDKERQVALESVFRDVATIVSEKCVNPASNRPYTVSMIEKAMRDVHFSAHPTRSAKQQALEVIKKLKEVMPIDRAKMKLRITTDEDSTPLKEALGELGVDSFDNGGGAAAGGSGEVLDFLVDPGLYRDVEEAVRTVAGGRCALEVLQLSVQQEGEADMDVELMRKGLLAVKLKGEEEGRSRGKKGRGEKGGGDGGSVSADAEEEEEVGLTMPAAGRRGKGRSGFSDDYNDNDNDIDQGRRKGGGGGGGARGQGRGAGEGGVGKRGGKKGKGARRREKEEAAERDMRQQEAQQRQEKREQAKAERLAEGAGTAAGATQRDRDIREQGGGDVGKTKWRLVCNTCGLTFPDTGAHREHYKSDLHRYNLKLKMKGGAPVSEEEFRLVDANDFFHSDMMNR
ncbi:unnamed protein product [Ectocarpus sp. 12 AP-2014]